MIKIRKLLATVCTAIIALSSLTVSTFAYEIPLEIDTNDSYSGIIPSDYDSAETFIYENTETIVSYDGKEAIIVAPSFDINYKYVFTDGGEGEDYTIESFSRYVNDYSDANRGGIALSFDVYKLKLESDKDINISMEFQDAVTQEPAKDMNLNISYTLKENGGFKISDLPTTLKQVEKFEEQNGNIKLSDEKVITVFRIIGAINHYELTNAANTLKPSVNNETVIGAFTVYAEKFDEKVSFYNSIGGGAYIVTQYSLDQYGTYGLKSMSAQKNNETASTPFSLVTIYDFEIKKNENGAMLVKNKIDKYETIEYGDVNFDSVVTLQDVVDVAAYVIKQSTFSETEICVADYNHDGKVGLIDAVEIARLLCNKVVGRQGKT